MKLLAFFALPALFAFSLSAAVKLPEASPGATVSRAVGISEVKVTYHSPAVKGRKIWGGLVPFGEIWRLGANEATVVELSHPARVGGKEIAAGRYAMFAIPERKEWTVVLNRKADQWGAYFYTKEEDVVRFSVKPEAAPMTEWLTFTIDPVSDSSARIEMSWEKVRVGFPVDFDTPSMVWKEIDEALAKPEGEETWSDFMQAATYAFRTGSRLDEAMQWVDRSVALKESFWNYELKARLLDRSGRTREALPLIAKAIELAEGKAPAGYIAGLKQQEAEWRKGLE